MGFNSEFKGLIQATIYTFKKPKTLRGRKIFLN